MINKNKALFMDIDGTVVEDRGYVSKPQDLKLLRNIPQALVKAQEAGYILIFHSNKGGAFEKKGLTADGLKKLDSFFKKMLAKQGVDTKKVYTYYCPHYVDKKNQIQCTCRKPKTGLFERAIQELQIDPEKSFGIGDKVTDLLPALAVSIRKVALVKRNGADWDIKGNTETLPFEKYNDVSEAVDGILNLGIG
jgi:D-glycero-D-manno-heptose 1,7-bisphosphate phosphatase